MRRACLKCVSPSTLATLAAPRARANPCPTCAPKLTQRSARILRGAKTVRMWRALTDLSNARRGPPVRRCRFCSRTATDASTWVTSLTWTVQELVALQQRVHRARARARALVVQRFPKRAQETHRAWSASGAFSCPTAPQLQPRHQRRARPRRRPHRPRSVNGSATLQIRCWEHLNHLFL